MSFADGELVPSCQISASLLPWATSYFSVNEHKIIVIYLPCFTKPWEYPHIPPKKSKRQWTRRRLRVARRGIQDSMGKEKGLGLPRLKLMKNSACRKSPSAKYRNLRSFNTSST